MSSTQKAPSKRLGHSSHPHIHLLHITLLTSSQIGNAGFGQWTPGRQVIGPFGRPEPSSGNTLAVTQPAQPQPPVQQQQPQILPAPQAAPVNPPAGQPLPTPQGQLAGPPGGQPPPGPSPGGPPGGLPQAAVPQQGAQAPHGTDGAMKGQSPTIFDGNRLKTNLFLMQFQLWWMINSMAEAMINPFQRIALCLSFIRGEQVDNWVEEKINQL